MLIIFYNFYLLLEREIFLQDNSGDLILMIFFFQTIKYFIVLYSSMLAFKKFDSAHEIL
jgi:hypothetical protein